MIIYAYATWNLTKSELIQLGQSEKPHDNTSDSLCRLRRIPLPRCSCMKITDAALMHSMGDQFASKESYLDIDVIAKSPCTLVSAYQTLMLNL